MKVEMTVMQRQAKGGHGLPAMMPGGKKGGHANTLILNFYLPEL